MKNAMKKLMSLVLVAVLLVSAVPFAASAAEIATEVSVNVRVKAASGYYEDRGNVVIGLGGATTFSPAALVRNCYDGEIETYAFYNAKNEVITANSVTPVKNGSDDAYHITLRIEPKVTVTPPVTEPPVTEPPATEPPATEPPATEAPDPTTYNVKFFNAKNECHWHIDVAAGSTVDVADNTTGTQVSYAEQNVGTKTGYTFVGWQMNGQGDVLSTATAARLAINATTSFYPVFVAKQPAIDEDVNNDNVVDEEFMKDIWLYIYTNNDLLQPAKRVLLNNYTIVADHTLNKAEALTVVDDYYKASNANTGIVWKGMYRETTNIAAIDFITGNGRDDSITGLDVARSNGTVVIKVRVTGVTAISTAVADNTNPKTGDEIYMAVTVLGVSATALAAVMYFYNKKRHTA